MTRLIEKGPRSSFSLDGDVVAGLSGFEFRTRLFGETCSISPDERWTKLSERDSYCTAGLGLRGYVLRAAAKIGLEQFTHALW